MNSILLLGALNVFSPSYQPCVQSVYNLVYGEIIQQALDEKITINEKNSTIENLRALCRGQRSSFERSGE